MVYFLFGLFWNWQIQSSKLNSICKNRVYIIINNPGKIASYKRSVPYRNIWCKWYWLHDGRQTTIHLLFAHDDVEFFKICSFELFLLQKLDTLFPRTYHFGIWRGEEKIMRIKVNKWRESVDYQSIHFVWLLLWLLWWFFISFFDSLGKTPLSSLHLHSNKITKNIFIFKCTSTSNGLLSLVDRNKTAWLTFTGRKIV